MSKIDEMNALELRVIIASERGCVFVKDGWGCIIYKDGIPIASGWTEKDAWKSACDSGKIPDYPSDIAAAFELAEDMNAHGYTVNIQIDHNGTIVFVKERGIITREAPIEATFAKITPEAISRAWLKWKENSDG